MKYSVPTATTLFQSPLGWIRLVASEKGLSGVWFEGQHHDASRWPTSAHHPVLQQTMRQLTQYFDQQRQHFELPLDRQAGTSFQQSVWLALQGIGYGQTCSYGALSARIGRPMAVRAVGSAVGRNPLCIVVPCHRVLGATGQLTGYAGGLERKLALLKIEGKICL